MSAARQAPFAAAAALVAQIVVLEDRLLVTGGQLAVHPDGRRVPHLLPGGGDLQIPRPTGGAGRRHEDKPVPCRQPDGHGREHRQIRARVDVDRFQRPYLVAFVVDHVMPAPLPDIASIKHRSSPYRPSMLCLHLLSRSLQGLRTDGTSRRRNVLPWKTSGG